MNTCTQLNLVFLFFLFMSTRPKTIDVTHVKKEPPRHNWMPFQFEHETLLLSKILCWMKIVPEDAFYIRSTVWCFFAVNQTGPFLWSQIYVCIVCATRYPFLFWKKLKKTCVSNFCIYLKLYVLSYDSHDLSGFPSRRSREPRHCKPS